MRELLLISQQDNVATALRDLSAGEDARFFVQGEEQCIAIHEAIPFGHKVAITDISPGELIVKYGEVIGRCTQPIAAGHHVHIHNVEGIRGRGDLSQGDETN
jgi:altronate dehydratase small subunit